MKKIVLSLLLFCLQNFWLTAQIFQKKLDDQQILANHQRAEKAARQPIEKSKNVQIRNGSDDLDDDGMPDAWETAEGLNPANPRDAFGDRDGDGVLNLFEFQLGTSPNDEQQPKVVNVSAGSNLNAVLKSAKDQTLIRVQGGTFPLNYISFTNPHPRIHVQGGWNASFTQRDICQFQTVLDGGLLGEVFYVGGATGGENAVILDGLTLTNGSGVFGSIKFISRGGICRWGIVDCEVRDNFPEGTFGGAIELLHWDSTQAEVTLLNNLITRNACDGIYNQTSVSATARWRFFNNTIAHNFDLDDPTPSYGLGMRGFTLDAARLEMDLTNCNIWGNDEFDIAFNAWADSVLIRLHRSNFGNTQTLGIAAILPDADCILEDPAFVDAASGNFRLAPGSPCLDAGLEVGLRFEGSAPDIGATPCLRTISAAGQPDFLKNGAVAAATSPFGSELRLLRLPNFSGKMQVKIFDLAGRFVAEKISPAGAQAVDFQTDAWLAGIYFFQILAADGSVLQTFRGVKI